MNLTQFEKAYLEVLRKRKARGKLLKRPSVGGQNRIWPTALALSYAKWLEIVFMQPIKSFTQMAKEKSKKLLMDSLDRGEIRNDEDEDAAIWAMFSAEMTEFKNQLMAGNLELMAGAIFGFAESVYAFEQKQFQKIAMATIGHAWEEENVWAQEALKEWQKTQLTLIESVAEKQIGIVGALVKDGVKIGLHTSEIVLMLERELETLSRAKAKLIARDQTGKLYGLLTQYQDQSVGIEEYDWRTSADERVRGNPTGKYKNAIPSHYIMHGKTCLWSDPSVWLVDGVFVEREAKAPKAHPGMEIQCRCTSVARVDKLFDKLLAQI